ncbi:MAG TPA: hypothetical protein DD462_11710, partial [Leeuwenhoekiella sp.]|nr:hypothetical protein [Leeuwenhoekiella sp.]
MVNFTFRNFIFTLSFFLLLLIDYGGASVYSQNRTFATNVENQLNVYPTTTDVFGNPIPIEDELDNLNVSARIEAGTGLLLGLGAYSGNLEVSYDDIVPAGTTTYVRVNADDDFLRVLLGGSLGELLSDVLGIVLIGNQEFEIQAKLNSIPVLSADSTNPNSFGTDQVRVVTDPNGDIYIAITPNIPYDRISITNRVGSLLGLGNVKNLYFNGAFYIDSSSSCNEPLYTSFDGGGLNLELLNLNGFGVTNPEFAIDDDLLTFSEISTGTINVAGFVEQIIYFDRATQPTEDFKVTLKVDPSLLALGVANNIELEAYNGTNLVSSSDLSSLLNLDLLGLLEGGTVAAVPFDVAGAADRILVRYNSLVGVNLLQSLDLYDVAITPGIPIIDAASEDVEVCEGESASLVATTASAG